MDDHRKALDEQLQQLSGGEHAQHVAELRAELERQDPRPAVLAEEFERLQSHPDLGVKLTTWWNDPKTQAFIAELNGLGI